MHSNKFACEVPFVVSSTLTHLKKFFLLFVQTSELQNMKHTLPKKEDKKIQQGISHTIVHNIQYWGICTAMFLSSCSAKMYS